VGGIGWFAYYPVDTVYDSATVNGLTRFMSFRGLSQVNVFRPRADYVTFDPFAKTFRVYFDVVSSSGSVNAKGTSITNTTNFVALPSGSSVVPTNYFIIDANNVVLPPIWVIYRANPTSSIRSALTITPLTAP
jgi:hypothetical protein